MDLGSLIGNVASGGILGAVGGIAQAGLQMWQAKQAADHALEMKKLDQGQEKDRWAHDLEMAKFESQSKQVLAEIDMSKTVRVEDLKALSASFEADKRSYATDGTAEKFPTLFAIVDFVRGVIRPWITIYLDMVLTVLCIWVTYEVMHFYPEVMKSGSLETIFKSLVEAIIFMSTTSTMWWFAARGIKVSLK